jgi:3-phosphoshikimate 1-carboxyvinyltransferase
VAVFIIEKPDKNLTGDITLPASKSISNRLLVIRALSPGPFLINNLSDSDDTRVLEDALKSDKNVINIGHAGTSMRFLTGYYAINPGERILTGSERMKNRPVGDLVEALRYLGAEIQYAEKEGFPPLRIRGKKIEGGKISVNSSISSQFISTLLMIAPVLKKGLEMKLTGKSVSPTYIELTLRLMQMFGIKYTREGSVINIRHQEYAPQDFTVEADWSSASYWYEMASLAVKAEMVIRGLTQSGLQGDSVLPELFDGFGVKTEFINNGVKLTEKPVKISRFDYNFINQPDLVQTFAVLCALKGIPFRFEGTQTLIVKETDRVQALKNELSKFGVKLESSSDGSRIEFSGTAAGTETIPGSTKSATITTTRVQTTLESSKMTTGEENTPEASMAKPGARTGAKASAIIISTYDDHRMAMAFAPVALLGHKIDIENPEVVSKSYPCFWKDLTKVGFKIRQ